MKLLKNSNIINKFIGRELEHFNNKCKGSNNYRDLIVTNYTYLHIHTVTNVNLKSKLFILIRE